MNRKEEDSRVVNKMNQKMSPRESAKDRKTVNGTEEKGGKGRITRQCAGEVKTQN